MAVTEQKKKTTEAAESAMTAMSVPRERQATAM